MKSARPFKRLFKRYKYKDVSNSRPEQDAAIRALRAAQSTKARRMRKRGWSCQKKTPVPWASPPRLCSVADAEALPEPACGTLLVKRRRVGLQPGLRPSQARTRPKSALKAFIAAHAARQSAQGAFCEKHL
eukprot:6191496-Pleurochrysis_carterae.AAC.2